MNMRGGGALNHGFLIFCDRSNDDDGDDDDDDDSVTDLSTYMGVMVLPGRRYQRLKNHW